MQRRWLLDSDLEKVKYAETCMEGSKRAWGTTMAFVCNIK